jgi:hypothetical protein
VAAPSPAAAQEPVGASYSFLEGNHCGGTQAGWAHDQGQKRPLVLPFPEMGGMKNDEARSVLLANVPAGTVVRVYDAYHRATDAPDLRDDRAEIRVHRRLERRCVLSFQVQELNTGLDYTLTFHPKRGTRPGRSSLDGKVSLVVIEGPRP